MKPINLVLFVEEPSAKDLVGSLLERFHPILFTNTQVVVFQGKQDLEKRGAGRLRAWQDPHAKFLITRDQDSLDCRDVKRRLSQIASEGRKPNAIIRVVCRELESWILGDFEALATAYNAPRVLNRANKIRNPDSLASPYEEVRKLVPDYQKRDGARRVGRAMVPSRNTSASFKVFWRSISEIAQDLQRSYS